MDPEPSGRISPTVAVKRYMLELGEEAGRRGSGNSPVKRPGSNDVEEDSNAFEGVVSDFEDVGLEDLCLNPFDIIRRVANFGTKLLKANREYVGGGRKLQILKERDEAQRHFESAKQAIKVVMKS